MIDYARRCIMDWTIWLLIGAVAAVLEIILPGFYMLSITASAIGGTLASALGFPIIAQFAMALVFLILFTVFLRPVLSKSAIGRKNRLIGKIVTITKSIEPPDMGRGRVDGVEWLLSSDIPIKEGNKARIDSVGGAHLHVELYKGEEE